MGDTGLGSVYEDGEAIVRQGEHGETMFVVRSGELEVSTERDGDIRVLALLGPGEFFGEMALFDGETRSATVKAIGRASVITVDKSTLMRRISEDPSLAFRMLQKMSTRIRGATTPR